MIFQLAENIQLNRLKYERVADQIARLRSKLEKTTSNLKDVVVSGSRSSSFDLTLNRIQELENDLKEIDFEYLIYKNEMERMEKIFKEFNDRNQLIYFDYKLRKLTPTKIQLKYGIGRTRFFEIIKEIESELI